MTTKTIAGVGLALILYAIPAQAFAKSQASQSVEYDRHSVSGGFYYGVQPQQTRPGRVKSSRRTHVARSHENRIQSHSGAGEGAQIVAHPEGCPSRAFCGCGASIEVFGRSIRELWLARNWLRFPPAEPAPGMVAVRNHHVFVIREVMARGLVLAYDANSGGHRTHIHLRSLAGYSVRNPHGSSHYASAG